MRSASSRMSCTLYLPSETLTQWPSSPSWWTSSVMTEASPYRAQSKQTSTRPPHGKREAGVYIPSGRTSRGDRPFGRQGGSKSCASAVGRALGNLSDRTRKIRGGCVPRPRIYSRQWDNFLSLVSRSVAPSPLPPFLSSSPLPVLVEMAICAAMLSYEFVRTSHPQTQNPTNRQSQSHRSTHPLSLTILHESQSLIGTETTCWAKAQNL